MDHKIQDRMCSIHKGQKCIVVNIDPKCSKDQRHCCAICIGDQSQLRIMKDYEQTKVYLEENFKKYKSSQEAQNRVNLDVLNQMSFQLSLLQKNYNQILDDLQKSVNDQIKYIMEESISLEDRLKVIEIDNFFSNEQLCIKEFHNEKFRKEIQDKFDLILKSDVMTECLNSLQKLDIKAIKLQPPKIKDDQVLEAQKDLRFSFSCPFHQQPIRFLYLNEEVQPDRRFVCDTCFVNNSTAKAIQISSAKSNWNKIKDNMISLKKSIQDKFRNKLTTIEEVIKEHQQKQVQLMNAAILDLQQKQKYLDNLTNQIESFNKEWIQLTIEEAKQIIGILINPNQQQAEIELEYEVENDQLNTILENSLKKVKTDQEEFFDSFTQLIGVDRTRISILINPQPTSNISQEVYKDIEKRSSQTGVSIIQRNQNIDFQVIQQSKKVQNEVCNAMAMNKQLTILVAGCGKSIQIFDFIEGKLKQTQQLNDHTGDITCLYFMKNTNQFISGSADNTIRFWGLNSFGQYGCDNIIKNAHSKQINQIMATKGEEIIITCGSIIKFWKKLKNEWEIWQKLKANMDGVYSISLNNTQNTLIATGCHGIISLKGGSICIIKPDHQGLWQIVQTIKTSDQGYKISFVSNNFFVFSKIKGGKLHFYEYNEQQKQYVKTIFIKIDAEDDVQMSLPLDYNQATQLIVNQHGKSINLIKVKGHQEFEVSQVIKFETNKISGVLSDDGQYLITWDNSSHEYIVRTNKDQ